MTEEALEENEDARLAAEFEQHDAASKEDGEHEELEGVLRALSHEFLNSGRALELPPVRGSQPKSDIL